MTKLEEIEARHARDSRLMNEGLPEGTKLVFPFTQAQSDRAYLLAEIKRLSAPVTDEEANSACRNYASDFPKFILSMKEALTAFLKGRMS